MTVIAQSLTILFHRNLKTIFRSPEIIFYAVVQPVIFILLFVFVLGGAFDIGGGNYIQYFIPTVMAQMVVFSAVGSTTSGVAKDLHSGIIDRLLILPVSDRAILLGRQLVELGRSVIILTFLTAIGLLLGFRFSGGICEILLGYGLLLAFGLAFTSIAAAIGVAAPTPESAQGLGLIWLFPLMFVSSAFVPISTMPDVLRFVAGANPITYLVDGVRGLFQDGRWTDSAMTAIALAAAIFVLFQALALAALRRKRMSR